MPRLCHAILYDADEKGREALAYGFEVDGLKVTATSDLEAARGLVTVTPGEVVVVVVRESDPGGIPLARRLAENPETRSVPRLVLAEAPSLPERLTGLPGPAGYLPLPAFVRDVVTATKLLAAGAASGEEATFEGALSDLGLFFIVRCMVGLGLSGIVEIERGARKGELRFNQGEIVSAQVGGLEGSAALHQLLLWEEAALVMRFRETVRRGQSFTKGEELLDDCARFLRDFEHATRSIGHAQSLFVQDAEKTASLLDVVPQELVPVMRLFDGHRNLGDVLEDSPFRVFDTLRSVSRLIELGTIRRKAIEKPSTGLTGQMRKPKTEDWLGRSAELPALSVTTTPATGVAPVQPAGVQTTQPLRSPPPGGGLVPRGRRSFRKKTGEHAIAPAPGPDVPGAIEPFSAADAASEAPSTAAAGDPAAAEVAVQTRAAEIPAAASPPEPPVAPAPVAAEPAVAPAAPVPTPVVAAPAVAAALPPRKAKGGILATHGELNGASSSHVHADHVEKEGVPKVLVELGPDLQDEPELASSEHLEDLPAAEPPPLPITLETRPAVPPTESPAEMPSNPNPGPTPQPLQRPPGVQTAEIDTGMRPPPPPELLEAPSGGPSIMLDPSFSQEMDAFELAHSQPTPPPVVVAPPPAAVPAPSPPAAEAPADPVVSFVRGVSAARSALAHTSFNASPTVPVSALPPSARPATHAPPPCEPTPPPSGAPPRRRRPRRWPLRPNPAANIPTPPPAPLEGVAVRPVERKERRASGEFDALESEFFAREAELYKKETVENFDDLDHGKGNNGKVGKDGKNGR